MNAEPWWPLQWSMGGDGDWPGAQDWARSGYADISATHPAAFGVWRGGIWKYELHHYEVALKKEAWPNRWVGKRVKVYDLLELRTLLIALAYDRNCMQAAKAADLPLE